VAITGGTINNVSLSNITYGGLGTMATQNANAVAITGGAINGTVLGNTGASTAVFTNMDTTTGNATTMNVTSSTITNLRSSNATITGSSINGTLIGNATPSSGAFTTLTASANVNFDSGTLFVDGTNNRVGVGTTAPTVPLDIVDSAASGTGLRVLGGGAGGPLATFTRNIGATGTVAINSSGGSPQATFNSASTTFAVGVSSTNFKISNSNVLDTTDRFVINSSGNVGIGNATPGSTLTVAGVVESTTGGVKFPDGTTQTTAAAGGPAALNVTLQQSYGGF
jgi:hypothetical protein